MKDIILSTWKKSTKYWWVSLLIGLFALILGVWSLFRPDATFVALIYLFIASFFASGVLEIIHALTVRKERKGWGWILAGGIVDLAFGFLLMSLPMEVISAALIYFIGFWIMFRSIWAIGEASEFIGLGVPGSGLLLVVAILGLLFSFLYLFSPAIGGAMITALASLAIITYGIYRIVLALKLRSIYKIIKEDF